MNRAPAMVTQDGADACAVYLGDDVFCVGRIELGLRESLRRVAYRDVARLVAWESRRQHVRILAWLILVALVVVSLFAFADEAVVPGFLLLGFSAIPFGILMWRGRLGGVTRFRVESARTQVTGVLGGSAAKRARILEALEQRIRERQTGDADAAPDSRL